MFGKAVKFYEKIISHVTEKKTIKFYIESSIHFVLYHLLLAASNVCVMKTVCNVKNNK